MDIALSFKTDINVPSVQTLMFRVSQDRYQLFSCTSRPISTFMHSAIISLLFKALGCSLDHILPDRGILRALFENYRVHLQN